MIIFVEVNFHGKSIFEQIRLFFIRDFKHLFRRYTHVGPIVYSCVFILGPNKFTAKSENTDVT